jgi:uncharacterized LabA/DUF88 family protein
MGVQMTVSPDFTKKIIELGGEVRYLQQQAPSLNIADLDKKLQQYRQNLQALYDSAEQKKIDLTPYYDALAEIEANLKIAEAGFYPGPHLEKIALFIDGANLAVLAYDYLNTKLDFAKLLTYFGRNCYVLRAFYYAATYLGVDEARSNIGFLSWLGRNGYQVVTKPMREYADGKQKGNLDIEIAIDMLELADKVDRVVLFSGDGDFAPLLRKVGEKGAVTQVVSYWGDGRGPTAAELIEAADKFIELQELLPFISKSDQ